MKVVRMLILVSVAVAFSRGAGAGGETGQTKGPARALSFKERQAQVEAVRGAAVRFMTAVREGDMDTVGRLAVENPPKWRRQDWPPAAEKVRKLYAAKPEALADIREAIVRRDIAGVRFSGDAGGKSRYAYLILTSAADDWRVYSMDDSSDKVGLSAHLKRHGGLRDFGINRGEPIDRGFFFQDGKWVAAPYVVERRGVEVYINNVLVDGGPEWPAYDYRVPDDPGDPPPGSSFFDQRPPGVGRRDTYWSRKWRYLYSHFDHDTAKRTMFESYKKSAGVRDVQWTGMKPGDTKVPNTLLIVRDNGRTLRVSLRLSRRTLETRKLTKEQVLASRDRKKAFFERHLGSDSVLSRGGGAEMACSGSRVYKMLKILLSDKPDSQKYRALTEEGIMIGAEPYLEMIRSGMKTNPTLAEYCRRFVKRWDKKE